MKKFLAVMIYICAALFVVSAKPKIKSFTEKERGVKYTMEYIGGNIYYEMIKYEGQYEEDYLNCWRSFGYEIEEITAIESNNFSSLEQNMLTELGIPQAAQKAIYKDRLRNSGFFKSNINISNYGWKYGNKLVYFIQKLKDYDEKWLQADNSLFIMKVCSITECKENIEKYTAKNLKLKDTINYLRK